MHVAEKNKGLSILIWIAVALLGAFALGTVALTRRGNRECPVGSHRGCVRVFDCVPLLQQIHC